VSTKVLVVDDRREVRAWIADVLLENAYDVRTAQCGLEALDQMAVWTPDVVLTDIRMPRMNGLELMLRIRQAQREIGIVAMSEMETARDAAVATQLGADRFLLKPFSRAELLAAIEAARAVPEPARARPLTVPPPAPPTTSLRTVTHRWTPNPADTMIVRLPAPWRRSDG
jgi:CheY-like chemotaxis protein